MKNANPVSVWAKALVLATAVSLSSGCGRSDPASPAAVTNTEVKGASEYFPIKVGERTVKLQLAVRMAEMQRGLMGRTDLKSDEGMLFVYAQPQQMSFWMRNTPTALDIGYFGADGVLKEVRQMHPFDETPVPSQSAEIQFALEMKQGWFEFNDVKPGAKLDLKALAEALRARGFEPGKYGLNR